MGEREKKEKQHKRIGWLTSVGVQLLLLIIFYFIVTWREPFPPIQEYGIELGFTSLSGATSSSVQAPVTDENPQEQEEQSDYEPNKEIVEAEKNIQKPAATVTKTDLPARVEEAKPEESKPVEEKPKVHFGAVMTPSEADSEDSNDKPSEGKEEKKVDQRAIYGSQSTNTGDTEGANLALSGWIWDFKPKPDDQSDQSGKIVYKIVVDQDGYLVKIETITSTVSPSVERKYRQAVEKLTYSKTADYKTAPVSTGTITFIIKSR